MTEREWEPAAPAPGAAVAEHHPSSIRKQRMEAWHQERRQRRTLGYLAHSPGAAGYEQAGERAGGGRHYCLTAVRRFIYGQL
jgi:hypothetical protein